MPRFEVRHREVGHGWFPKFSDEDLDRGGGWISSKFYIAKDGKEYISCGEYAEKLSQSNTIRQNRYIQRVSPWLTFLDGEPMPKPPETTLLCDLLNAHYPTEQEEAA